MKKLFIIIAMLVSAYLGYTQENQIFYYHSDEKIYLDKIENTKVIHFKKTIDAQQKEDFRNRLKASDCTITEINSFMYKVSNSAAQLEKNSIVAATKNSNVSYISDMLMYGDSIFQWPSNEMFVKIHPTSSLENILQENKIPFVGFKQFGFDKQTYLVELDVAENTAIEYANTLSETGKVVWAQPSFWRFIRKYNELYPNQWGLNNTGQYNGTPGIDINAVNAWSIATGTGIKVAVLDSGVDLVHPDLENNLLPGYDATDGLDGAANGEYGGLHYSKDNHGTACSGIIAAADNDKGIKGVAYNAQIIPIRIAYGAPYTAIWIVDDTWYVNGIHHAWHEYGADILSNSYGVSSPSMAIEAEINAALTHGRNSLGCVVIYAVGNSNNEVAYPAKLPEVIAVGAISQCGTRKRSSSDPAGVSCDGQKQWGSNYGTTLDIVAPGVNIYTTHIHTILGTAGNYLTYFNGTSAACPHVAGVAALILSVNPNLTGQQVRDIIESTAQKVGGYNYQTTPGRSNGIWHEEMGYGLVDAYAAVQAACTTVSPVNFTNQTVTTNTEVTSCGDINIQDVTVTNNAKLTLEAPGTVTVNPNFKVELGSGLKIK